MKKILLSFALVASLGFASRLQAQCTLSNIAVNLNSATPSGPNCIININIAFDMLDNDGNKYIWINLWKSTDYNFISFNYDAGGAKGPKLDEIDGSDNTHPPVAVIGINNNVAPVAYLTSYTPDGAITPTTGTTITNTPVGNVSHFVLSNVTFTVPGGCAGLVIQGDVWSTQANSENSPIHCASKGVSFYGDPTINGLVTCPNPNTSGRKVQVLLNTVSIAPITVNYTVYIDKGTTSGVLDAGDPVAIATTANFGLSDGTPYNSGLLSYIGNNINPDASFPLLVVLKVVSPFSKTISGIISNSCGPLPVQFKSFTAARNHSTVGLKWETSSEQNNSGFAIERLIGAGSWQQIAFVPSQAAGGNSNADLTYQYSDLNDTRSMSQYRLKQIDFDNQSKFSDIRAVRGEGEVSRTIVYPNPSNNGKVTIVFEDVTATRDISLMDMNGRMIKQIKAVANNNIQFDNLTPGIYSLRVVVRETGNQVVEKIVINNR